MNRKVLRVPDNILVELTNHCNLRCPVCPTTQSMKRKRGYMEFETFDGLLYNLRRHGLRPRLRFTFAGEPMLHKEIVDFVSLAHRYHFRTDICTNGTVCVGFDHSPSTMTVDVDGIGEAHERYRRGVIHEEVVENIKCMVADNPGTMFTMQCLITKWSEGQEGEIIELAEEIGITRVRFKSVHTGHGMVKGKEDIRPVFPSNVRTFRWTPICLSPYRHVVVYWDGSIGLCCVDYDNVAGSQPSDTRYFVESVESFGGKWCRMRAIMKGYGICKGCEMTGAQGMSREVWL